LFFGSTGNNYYNHSFISSLWYITQIRIYLWGASGLSTVRELLETPRTLFFEQGVTQEIRNITKATGSYKSRYCHTPFGATTQSPTNLTNNPVQYAGSVGCYTEDDTN
jgi:hypothetical protein